MYSKTCLQQPLKGPSNCGLCRQVVLVRRCFSTTEVDNEAVHRGSHRQVVFLCEQSLRQALLYVYTREGHVYIFTIYQESFVE